MLSGQEAEKITVAWLQEHGYVVIDTNWHGPGCELDIVAKKDRKVHIVEVKYRKDTFHGDPLEYVNASKRRQLLRGAKAWTHAHNWEGEMQIDLAGIEGDGAFRWIENAVYDE